MNRFHRAATAIILTVTTGAIAVVDTAQASIPVPAAPAVAEQVYTVSAGDYLFGIASRMGVGLSSLLATNNLTIDSLIYPGMQLLVPDGGTVPTPAAPAAPSAATEASAAATYTVVAGDYLSGIAARMGVNMSLLLSANNLTVASVIHPGTLLVVPAGGALPVVASLSPSPSPATAAAVVAGPESGVQYVVRSGDYLTGIAPALGVRLADLLSLNNLTMTSLIYPGMKLDVPEGGTLPVVDAPVSAAATPAPAASSTDDRLNKVLAFAQAQLGKPYKYNSAGPDSWDCSGLTMAAYAEIGISLPHFSGAQVNYGTVVEWATQPIVAGDLVFLESSVGSGVISHVGIAISATQWIQAPRSGEVVRTGNIPSTRVIAVRRLVPAA